MEKSNIAMRTWRVPEQSGPVSPVNFEGAGSIFRLSLGISGSPAADRKKNHGRVSPPMIHVSQFDGIASARV
jgi:hypothetical protein